MPSCSSITPIGKHHLFSGYSSDWKLNVITNQPKFNLQLVHRFLHSVLSLNEISYFARAATLNSIFKNYPVWPTNIKKWRKFNTKLLQYQLLLHGAHAVRIDQPSFWMNKCILKLVILTVLPSFPTWTTCRGTSSLPCAGKKISLMDPPCLRLTSRSTLLAFFIICERRDRKSNLLLALKGGRCQCNSNAANVLRG